MNSLDVSDGILHGTFEELYAAGCIQTGADVTDGLQTAHRQFGDMFQGLVIATRGNLCDGCPALNGGKCPAYRKHHSVGRQEVLRETTRAARTTLATKPRGTARHPNKSMKQIAAELKISISEARRRKQRGEL